ncbi:MAG TPA: phospho-N-acetylmuramoyl-pentapeptide-transferase [Acidimicrobiales bacterium]|nr:phospho-N-acetylmuramoyl-pentapeptide-transferase [Acidimicrobiales bacterium]
MVGLLIAAGVAMMVSLGGTLFLIDWLRNRGIGQPIREDGPEGHQKKAGTPTMGGVAIVAAALAGYVVAHFRGGVTYTRSGLLVMAAIGGAGAVGLVDDWIKVTRERNLGLNKRAKVFGLLVVAIGFAALAVWLTPVHVTLSFTRFNVPGLELTALGWCVLAVLMILGSSNAVNLTDGLDGLAAGSAIYAFICYTVIGFWGFRHSIPTENIYHLDHAYDLSICAAAMAGACAGFLWWNANPARIIMGDTGALAIGTGLAALSLMTSTELLLLIVGGLFVIETVSVIVQVTAFRVFGGRRVLRMAPIHHHFELGGWPETTVIVRFWILAGLFTALALGFFYADFLRVGTFD